MLDALRTAAGTWVAKLLLLLLVGSFAVWGISSRMIGGFHQGSTVVTAGATQVSVNDYRLAYDRQVQVMSQQFGQRLTDEQARLLGIDNQVLGQLIAGAVLDEQARQMGLGLSRDRLAALTAEDPAFHGENGQFDRSVFDYVLRQVNMRPEDYLANRSHVAIRQQIVEAVVDGAKAPDAFLNAVALYRGEGRTIEYLVLPRSLVEPIEEPAPSALQSWFEERKATYAAPEYRKIAYVKLEPADITDPAAISDEQVRQDYDRNVARYTTPETRTLEQISFPAKADADAALAAIKAGSTFDQVATDQKRSAADIRLGTFTAQNLPDPALAPAFTLPLNQVSDVIEGLFGPVLVRVTEIKPRVVQSFDDVKDTIRTDLALAEANRVLLDVHDSYEDARGEGASLQEAANKLKLQLVTVDAVDRNGMRPDNSIVNDLPASAELLNAAFESDVGVDNDAVAVNANGFVFYEVQAITPARDRTLDEMRERVVGDWKAEQVRQRLDARATDLKKRLDGGATLDTVATELSLEKQTKYGLKREADDAEIGKPGVAAAFSVAEGGTGLVEAPSDDAKILFKVTEVQEPLGADASTMDDAEKRNFGSGIADDLLDQLVSRLRGEYAVTVNDAVLQQAASF